MIVFMAFTPMHSPTGKGYYLHLQWSPLRSEMGLSLSQIMNSEPELLNKAPVSVGGFPGGSEG